MYEFEQLVAQNPTIQEFENYLSTAQHRPYSWKFLLAAAQAKIPETRNFLIKQARVDKKEYSRLKFNKFHMAALLGKVDTLEKAPKEKLSAETNNYYGWHPIHVATVANNSDAVKFIAGKADVNAKTHHAISPLSLAVQYNMEEMVALLISLGADVKNSQIIRGLNPNTSESIFSMLLDAGFDFEEGYGLGIYDNRYSLEDNLKFIDRLFDKGLAISIRSLKSKLFNSNDKKLTRSLPILKAILNRSDVDINEKFEYVGKQVSLFEYAMMVLPLEVAQYLHSIGATTKRVRGVKKAKTQWFDSVFGDSPKLTFKEFMEMADDSLTPDQLLEQLTFIDGKLAGMNFPPTNEMLVANGFEHDDELDEHLFEAESITGGNDAQHQLEIDYDRMTYILRHYDEKFLKKVYKKLQAQFTKTAGKPKGKKTLYWVDAGRKLRLSLESSYGWVLRIEVTAATGSSIPNKLIDTKAFSKNIEAYLEDIAVDVFNEGETCINKFKVTATQTSASSPIKIEVEIEGIDNHKEEQSDVVTIEVEDGITSADPTEQLMEEIIRNVSNMQYSWETMF